VLRLMHSEKGYLINHSVEFRPNERSLYNRLTENEVHLQLPATLCFLYLIKNTGKVSPQRELIAAGWGDNNGGTSPNTFYQTILTLRNSLQNVGLPRDTIKTISRRGMMLSETTVIARLTACEAAEDDAPPLITPLSIPDEPIPQPVESSALPAIGAAQSPDKAPIRAAGKARMLLISYLMAGLFLFFILFNTEPAPIFSHYLPLSMQLQKEQSCRIFYEPNEVFVDYYLSYMLAHRDLCKNQATLYLSGLSSSNKITAFVCSSDLRTNPHAVCSTWLSVHHEK
jgi:DNA-binding winged helix-turn-helix (wHTH) protein